MINYQKTRFTNTDSSAVESGVLINDEGLALIAKREGENMVVAPSMGQANEVFAGFSYERTRRPEVLGNVEAGTVVFADQPAIKLARVPNAGAVAVFIDGSKVDVDAGTGAPAAATAVNLDGDMIYFHGDHDGKSFRVQYHYTPSLEEARSYGEGSEFGQTPPSYEVGVVGRITGGIVDTTAWDPEADWADESVMHPSLGENGLLTVGGSGTKLTNLLIKRAPMNGSAYLTVEFIL